MSPRLTPPEKPYAGHDLSALDSGKPALDRWLRRRTLANEDSGAARTYVVCEDGGGAGPGLYGRHREAAPGRAGRPT